MVSIPCELHEKRLGGDEVLSAVHEEFDWRRGDGDSVAVWGGGSD